ncbi:membrane protein [Terrihabitans soli]|uniref:Membrane protein n=1 Tax=Terrihabitans soli TaxID=708113 RepID=A0A6S6QL26_9HYPH|nr:AEC family transporter [Terrihabitans soli]BCJ91084.1 membrane protein [Terrihabitans soli]
MSATLSVVLPIFGLVLAGYLCRRTNIFSAAATSELNRFVVWLGLPALFFDITAGANWDEFAASAYGALAFTLACVIVFVITFALRLRRRGLGEAGMDALNASYPNSGYMGFPLGLLVFGPQSYPLVTISAIVTVCLFFGATLVLLEIDVREEKRAGPMIRAVTLSLVKNPLMISPVLGALFAVSGLEMPKGFGTLIDLLGAAASPCALVALGTFMADDREDGDTSPVSDIALLTVLKLILVPALAYVLSYHVFPMPKEIADLTILLAALPTGTGPFMLAQYYKRGSAITANTILYSTLASVVTLAAILCLTGHAG